MIATANEVAQTQTYKVHTNGDPYYQNQLMNHAFLALLKDPKLTYSDYIARKRMGGPALPRKQFDLIVWDMNNDSFMMGVVRKYHPQLNMQRAVISMTVVQKEDKKIETKIVEAAPALPPEPIAPSNVSLTAFVTSYIMQNPTHSATTFARANPNHCSDALYTKVRRHLIERGDIAEIQAEYAPRISNKRESNRPKVTKEFMEPFYTVNMAFAKDRTPAQQVEAALHAFLKEKMPGKYRFIQNESSIEIIQYVTHTVDA